MVLIIHEMQYRLSRNQGDCRQQPIVLQFRTLHLHLETSYYSTNVSVNKRTIKIGGCNENCWNVILRHLLFWHVITGPPNTHDYKYIYIEMSRFLRATLSWHLELAFVVFYKVPNTNAKFKNRSSPRDFANQTWHLSRWTWQTNFLARTSSSRRARSSFFPRSCFPARRSPVLRRRSIHGDGQSDLSKRSIWRRRRGRGRCKAAARSGEAKGLWQPICGTKKSPTAWEYVAATRNPRVCRLPSQGKFGIFANSPPPNANLHKMPNHWTPLF